MAGDEGYFPAPGSVLRQVHSERVVGLHFGQRALLIGALSPANYVGTALHTRRPELPYRRLADTARIFETVFFGSRAAADHELRRVSLMHDRVSGVMPRDAGPVSAGTPYSAHDPELMLWTLACIADSGPALYEAAVRPLSGTEQEQLWQEYRRFGELFGLPRSATPSTHAEFRRYWRERLNSSESYLTASAHQAGIRSAFRIPVPRAGRLGARVGNLLILGTVPSPVRRLYGLAWGPAQQRAYRGLTAGLRACATMTPARLRRGSNERFFELVERTERRRVSRGEQTWRVSA